MTAITKFLKGVFNFFVGDWIILGGVLLLLIIVGLIEQVEALKPFGGYVFIAGLVLTLVVTLRRETQPK